MRRGYMGHVTNISNAVVQCLEKGKNKQILESILSGMCCSGLVKSIWKKCKHSKLTRT